MGSMYSHFHANIVLKTMINAISFGRLRTLAFAKRRSPLAQPPPHSAVPLSILHPRCSRTTTMAALWIGGAWVW